MTKKKPDPARNSPARIEARDRAAQAVSLRARGLPWAEVARRAGYPSPDAARVAVNRALDRVEADGVADLRAEEDAHLLLLRQSAMAGALEGAAQSVAVLLRISESRRKLYGADLVAPRGSSVSATEQDLVDQLTSEFNELIEHEREEAREEGLRQAREAQGICDER